MAGYGKDKNRHGSKLPHWLVLRLVMCLGFLRDLNIPSALDRVAAVFGTPASWRGVVPHSTSVAKALDAEMVLLRVSIVHIVGSLMGEWTQPLEGDLKTADQYARDYLDQVAGRLAEGGIKVSTTVQMGAVTETIIDYARAEKIDMIAMCTHGRTGLNRWAMGSVADRVLRAGGTPILLVRAG